MYLHIHIYQILSRHPCDGGGCPASAVTMVAYALTGVNGGGGSGLHMHWFR